MFVIKYNAPNFGAFGISLTLKGMSVIRCTARDPTFAFKMKEELTIIFLFIAFIAVTKCRILGTFVMPHGGIALDPSQFNTTNQTAKTEAVELHDACELVGKQIGALDPDLIFLSTPHGISDLNNFVFYLNPTGYGKADTDNCQCPPCCFSVKIKIDNSTSLNLVKFFKTFSNVSGLSGFGPPGQSEEPFPLRY